MDPLKRKSPILTFLQNQVWFYLACFAKKHIQTYISDLAFLQCLYSIKVN